MMKRRIFLIIGVVAFAVVLAFNINTSISNDKKNDVALANVEVLAYGEDISANMDCSGSGQIYCYLTNKSEYKEVHIYQ